MGGSIMPVYEQELRDAGLRTPVPVDDNIYVGRYWFTIADIEPGVAGTEYSFATDECKILRDYGTEADGCKAVARVDAMGLSILIDSPMTVRQWNELMSSAYLVHTPASGGKVWEREIMLAPFVTSEVASVMAVPHDLEGGTAPELRDQAGYRTFRRAEVFVLPDGPLDIDLERDVFKLVYDREVSVETNGWNAAQQVKLWCDGAVRSNASYNRDGYLPGKGGGKGGACGVAPTRAQRQREAVLAASRLRVLDNKVKA